MYTHRKIDYFIICIYLSFQFIVLNLKKYFPMRSLFFLSLFFFQVLAIESEIINGVDRCAYRTDSTNQLSPLVQTAFDKMDVYIKLKDLLAEKNIYSGTYGFRRLTIFAKQLIIYLDEAIRLKTNYLLLDLRGALDDYELSGMKYLDKTIEGVVADDEARDVIKTMLQYVNKNTKLNN